jgi:hypothetical protein
MSSLAAHHQPWPHAACLSGRSHSSELGTSPHFLVVDTWAAVLPGEIVVEDLAWWVVLSVRLLALMMAGAHQTQRKPS